jgi:hypothetical protein
MSMYHEVIEALSLLVQTLDKLGIVWICFQRHPRDPSPNTGC